MSPLSGSGTDNIVWKDGSHRQHGMDSKFSWTGAGYFKPLEIPILSGRDFDSRETPQSPKVAIVSESFARRLGLGRNPVGKTFWREATPHEPMTPFEIVGLTKDAKNWGLREDFGPVVYLPLSQDQHSPGFEQPFI